MLIPTLPSTWAPSPRHSMDIPIMEIATSKYDKTGSWIINKCRIYLQLISIFDLLIHNMTDIHPSYIQGGLPQLRLSSILWPSIQKPQNNT
jgi:hypothetical protein